MTHRVLFVGRGAFLEDAAGHQALALMERQAEFKRRGYEIDFVHTEDNEERKAAASRDGYDSVLITFHWQNTAEEVVEALKQIRKTQRAKLLFVDWYDQTCSPHWCALPYVDVYLKPCVLRDMGRYQNEFRGGYIFTDFLEKQMGYDLKDFAFSSPLPQQYVDRICLVGNIASLKRYERFLGRGMRYSLPFRLRPIDINTRFTVGTFQGGGGWYSRYRGEVRDRIAKMRGVRVSGEGRLSFRRYMLETALSRIVVSPFGWGEVCYRDYEAVCCGSLLVKPAMEHLRTEPDIYHPFETYIPVRWDLADLEEKCAYYLVHPGEAQAIIRRAAQVYREYFEQERYIALMEAALKKAHGTM